MIAVELFAGAGGAALGLHRAGLHHAACIERDPDAAATLAAAGFPAVCMDVADWLADGDLPAGPDLLWASPPCQPYSVAGKGLGADDDRDGWPLVLDAVDAMRPLWVIVENVRGCPAGEWSADLRGKGYAWVGHRLLNAADYGVPQHRRRVFIVAGPCPLPWPAPTHCDPRQALMLALGMKPWVSCREALGMTVGCYATHPEDAELTRDRRIRDLSDRPSVCLGTYSGSVNRAGQPMVLIPGNGGNAPAPRSLADPSHTVTGHTPMYLAPAPTIATAVGQGVGSAHARDRLEDMVGRRKLTPAECARLQDFPGDHPWQGTKTAIYRQIGNAVPPALSYALATAIRKVTR